MAAKDRRPWEWRTGRIETFYARQLRKIAKHIGDIVHGVGFDPDHPEQSTSILRMLEMYSRTIRPWAESAARDMVNDMQHRDRKAWLEHSQRISRGLRVEVENGPIAAVLQQRRADQVQLITSLPTDAAKRVQRLTQEALISGTRAREVAADIMRSGEVSAARANLIARTEVAKTASTLVQARAESIGSPGYFWRTSHDADVRPSHKLMDGKFVPWSQPPTLDKLTGHAGCLPNCRCYPEPVIPSEL